MKKNIFPIQLFWVQPRKKALTAALFVFIISFLFGKQLSLHSESMVMDEKHQTIIRELDIYGNALTITLNSYFGLFEGIYVFIDTENSFPTDHVEDTFNHLATEFYEGKSAIRNFSVAPDGVQMYVYPLEGNENVLGHDLINDERPEVLADIERTIETRQITLSGPYELRQGGLGLVARQAVYEGDDFWGLVAMVVDLPPILANAGLSENNKDLVFTLQDKNGDFFWGESEILSEQPVQYQVVLPDGYWTLSAAPHGGWDISSPRLLLIQISVVLISMILGLLTYLLVNRDERLQYNVTEKTRALSDVVTELAASEKKYRALYNNSPDMYVSVSPKDATILICNQTLLKKTGYSENEVIGSPVFMMYHDDCLDEVKKTFDEFVEKGIIYDRELVLKRKDGSRLDVVLNVDSVKNEKGDVLYSMSSWRDITERKKIDKQLQESEKRFRSLFRDSADAYLILDENIFVDCNQAAIEMLHANSKEEVLSTHPSQLSPEFQPDGQSSVKKANEIIRIALEQGSNRFEWIHRRKDGEDFPVEVLLTPIVVGDKTIIHTVWQDITEQKKARQEMLDTRNRLESIFKAVPAGIGVVVDRKIQFVNQRFIEMTGYTKEELIGNSSRLFYPSDEEFEKAGKEKYEKIAEQGTGAVETLFQKKNGSLINVFLSSTPIDPDDLSVGITFSALDITERKSAEDALKTLNIKLDERVGQRTAELHQTISAMANREIRMAELKKVITQLRSQLRKAGLEPEAYDPLLGPNREW